jgi:hypothetical protein
MKKVIFILIGISLVAVLFVGCDKEKSAGVLKCEESVQKMMAPGLQGPDPKKVQADIDAAVKACGHYEGGSSDDEVGKFIMGGEMGKIAEEKYGAKD